MSKSNPFADWSIDDVRRHNEQIQLNRTLKAGGAPQGAEPEQAIQHRPVGKAKGTKSNPRRYRVSIVSFRHREIDPDNLAPKYFIDGLKYCGIIEDDTAKHIELSVRQEKSEEERTEITIELLAEGNPCK